MGTPHQPAGKGRQGARYDLKERIEITTRISGHLAAGNTIETSCRKEGITARTFLEWRRESSEISDLYTGAMRDQAKAKKSRLRKLAMSSAEKRIKGFKVKIKEEVLRIVDGKPVKGTITKERYVPPSDQLIVFALTNEDEELSLGPVWTRTQHVEHSGEIGGPGSSRVDLSRLTDEQLEIYEKLQEQLADLFAEGDIEGAGEGPG